MLLHSRLAACVVLCWIMGLSTVQRRIHSMKASGYKASALCPGWRIGPSQSRHRIGGQWLFTVYAHAPSTFRPPSRSMFADVYIADVVDKVEWAQHSVVRTHATAAMSSLGRDSSF